MLCFYRTDVFEGIVTNKTNASKGCGICHYCYVFNKEFKFQLYVCNGCDDVLMMSIKLNYIAILNIPGVHYCCIINGIDKIEP